MSDRQDEDKAVARPDQAFQLYTPLKSWQTRILELEAGNFEDPLIADLHVADLIFDEGIVLHERQIKIKYKALSYCWGGTNRRASIQCNGRGFQITDNLFSALKHLRRTDKTQCLWIDAVCINQYDTVERSVQVAKILTIFHKASRVIVWLGEHGRHTRAVLDYVTGPGHDNRHTGDVAEEGLRELLARPWFRRLWVKQEVWAARRIDVRCGGDRFTWDELKSWASSLANSGPMQCHDDRKAAQPNYHFAHEVSFSESSNHSVFYSPFVTLTRASAGLVARASERDAGVTVEDRKNGIELISVLQRTASSECTDVRDHVYGVLGMARVDYTSKGSGTYVEKIHGQKLVVDYEKPVSQVFSDVVKYVVLQQRSLWVLMLDASYGDFVEGERLPSWCPNWSRPFRMIAANERRHAPENTMMDMIAYVDTALQYLRLCARQIAFLSEGKVYAVQDVYVFDEDEPPYSAQENLRFNGRSPIDGDIIIYVEGSLELLVIRRRKYREGYELVGWVDPKSLFFPTQSVRNKTRDFLKALDANENVQPFNIF